MNLYLRRITALLPKRFKKALNKRHIAIHLRRFLFVFFVILAGILLQLLVVLNTKYKEVQKDFGRKQEEYIYWTSVASQYPNVPDILYNAAVSSYVVGEVGKAYEYLTKALQIDPLFERAKILKEKVEGK